MSHREQIYIGIRSHVSDDKLRISVQACCHDTNAWGTGQMVP